ncbi:hypothetical protein [Ectobacillus polymachus]|uniref:hypothetical protein n=1 Tax=Ectobacillus polymachus TaxID=1508806 RepID=UPI003A8478A3
MLLFLAITAAIVTILPFLAPVAVILMIVFFFMRLNYIFQNWKAIIGGILVYGSFFWMISNASHVYLNFLQALIACGLGSVFLHFYMKVLYNHGYSASQALEIMGAVPVVLLALLLPFLKMFDFADLTLFHGHFSDGTTHVTGAQTEVPAAGVHHVNSYMRTAPDGIVENNLSYHGPGKIPNTPTVHVDSYVSTNPDGIVENNLSYHGSSHTAESSDSLTVSPDAHPSGSDVHIGTGVIVNEKENGNKRV